MPAEDALGRLIQRIDCDDLTQINRHAKGLLKSTGEGVGTAMYSDSFDAVGLSHRRVGFETGF